RPRGSSPAEGSPAVIPDSESAPRTCLLSSTLIRGIMVHHCPTRRVYKKDTCLRIDLCMGTKRTLIDTNETSPPPYKGELRASEFSHGPGLTPRGLEGSEFGPAEGGRYWGKPPPPTAADLGERRHPRTARVRRVTRWARGGGMSTYGDATRAGLSSLIVLDRSMISVI